MGTQHNEPTEPIKMFVPAYSCGDCVRVPDWTDLEHLLKGGIGGVVTPKDEDGEVICLFVLLLTQGIYAFYPVRAMDPDIFRCYTFISLPIITTFGNMLLLTNLTSMFGDQA